MTHEDREQLDAQTLERPFPGVELVRLVIEPALDLGANRGEVGLVFALLNEREQDGEYGHQGREHSGQGRGVVDDQDRAGGQAPERDGFPGSANPDGERWQWLSGHQCLLSIRQPNGETRSVRQAESPPR
ncbi:hypothetical protein [Allochromatium tepidum]|uniref:hypothetical protein n=1 Tax=Allochromatium tepidum TaxID=553982 RepID=UPI001F2C1D07|nr:hypothetical protein [Allochromatium tepidum]